MGKHGEAAERPGQARMGCRGVPFRPWPERSARSLSLWPGRAGLVQPFAPPGLVPFETGPSPEAASHGPPGSPERTFGRAEVFSETSDRRVYVLRLLITSAGPAHAAPTDPARSPPVAATVAGLAPFPRDEVLTEYGRFERGREDRANTREILPLKGEAAEGRWGNTALIQQDFPLRRLRRHLPHRGRGDKIGVRSARSAVGDRPRPAAGRPVP